MEDFPPPWEGDERSGRKKRRFKDHHRREFSDEGWGMAFDADMYDGDEGQIEDWAAGMVHEEGRDENWRDRRERDFEGDYDEHYPSSRYQYSGSYNINNSSQQGKPHDPKKPSPAIERAAQFMDRVEGRPRKHGRRVPERSRNTLRTDRRDRQQIARRGDYVDMPSRHTTRNTSRDAGRNQGCLATLFGFELDTNNLPMLAAMALIFVCILAFLAMMVFIVLSGVL